MSIRRYNKDHLKELAPALAVVPAATLAASSPPEDPLKFWTRHEHPTHVNLTPFAEGNGSPEGHQSMPTRGRPFSGRPELIEEMAPAIRAFLEYAAPRTVSQHLQALRTWWRLFDSVDRTTSATATQVVRSVSDIGALHRQRAFDENMDRGSFGNVLATINIVRKAKGLRQLPWQRPAAKSRERHLPPEWQVRKVRIALKHAWFAASDRWQRADELLAGRVPGDEEEHRLLKNYKLFDEAVAKTAMPRPRSEDVRGAISKTTFNREGFSMADMLRGRYPDAEDIRGAFHLCLATTGWNAAVFLSLDADSAFIEPHPKDPTRYLLRGYKARSKSEQISEGLYKSQGSAGVVLLTLRQRTAPLRARLREELAEQELAMEKLLQEGASSSRLDEQRKVVARLRTGASSLWLYVTSASDKINWLDPHETTYSKFSQVPGAVTYLDAIISGINRRQPPDQQLASLKPGDFRDAFAAYAYQLSGGMVLYVMKALGHKSLRSTQRYLDNTLLNEESAQLYRTFSNALWTEIKFHKRLDPTIIAKCSRDGDAGPAHRERLATYRNLRRSRIGVGCKDPTNPPPHIAPSFKADGKAVCYVHRCMLCLEHAVIFPDSIPGLAKRLAELRAIRSRMSTVAFLESSFSEETENTELALGAFDPVSVAEQVTDWESRIKTGLHRIVEFDGQGGSTV